MSYQDDLRYLAERNIAPKHQPQSSQATREAYAHRVAQAIRRQEAGGLPPSRQAARGEHPQERKASMPAPAEKYREVHRAPKARPLPSSAKKYGTGKIRAPARTKKEVRDLIKATPGKTVHSIAIEGKNGRWATAVVDIPVEDLLDIIDDDYDTWIDYLDDLGESLGDSDPENPTGNTAIVIA